MTGELLIIAAQLVFAVGYLFVKKLTVDANPLFVAALVTLIGALVLLPLLFYFSKELRLLTSQKFLWAVLAGIFWIAAGELLLLGGISKAPLSHAGVLMLTFPVFTTSLAVIFLGEAITFKFLFASFLMAAGYIILIL